MAKTITKKMNATAIVNFLETFDGEQILTVVDNDEDMVITVDSAIEYLKNEIELLSKKKSSKTSKEKAEANKALKDKISAVLADGEPMRVTDILAKGDFTADTSNQRISAMLRQMVADGVAIRTMDKKTALFSLA
jgi:crotonobetainyl-CoA:carnitine CoA-transferase CaiB-like acyl-CoA transferase